MEQIRRKSIGDLLGLPEGFRVTLATIGAIIALIPILPGTDLGMIKIPTLSQPFDWWVGLLIFLLILVILWVPIWPPLLRRGKKIILIDDESYVRKGLLEAGQKLGVSVYPLTDFGNEKIVRGHLSQFRPDGVILDLDFSNHPGINGEVLFKWIRSWNKNMPVVFYTRHADNATYDRIRKLGISEMDIFIKQADPSNDMPNILKRLQEIWESSTSNTPMIRGGKSVDGFNPSPTWDGIKSALKEDDAPTAYNPENWGDVLRFNPELGLLGEIHTIDDLCNLPREVSLRVVLFSESNGFVIRWVNEKYNDKISEDIGERPLDPYDHDGIRRYDQRYEKLKREYITHDKLATYQPKAKSEIYRGYFKLEANGTLQVRGEGQHVNFDVGKQ